MEAHANAILDDHEHDDKRRTHEWAEILVYQRKRIFSFVILISRSARLGTSINTVCLLLASRVSNAWQSSSFFSASMVLYWNHGSIGSAGSCLVGSCRQAPPITMCVYCGDPACEWCFEVVPNIGDVCGNCVVEFGHMMQIYQNHDTKSISWWLSTKDINAVCSCAFGKHGCSK